MRRFLPLALAAAILSTLPRASPADTLEEVRKRGALVAGVLDVASPFGYKDAATGEHTGIDVELVRALAGKLGVEARIVAIPASQRIPSLIERKVDLVAGAMTVNYDRARLVDFSKGYFRTNVRILARKGAFANVEELSGKRVGVVRGSTPDLVLRDDHPSVTLVQYPRYRPLVEALKRGEVDAVAGEGYILRGFLPDVGEGFEIATSFRISEETVALAVHKGDEALLSAVNDALSQLKKEGQIERIFNRYFQRSNALPLASSPETVAIAVVTRRGATVGRYLAVPVRGVFTEGSPVTFFTPQGNPVAKGTVQTLYDEAIYVDGPAANIAMGFFVGANLSDGGAKEFARSGRDILAGVKEATKREAAEVRAEIKAEAKEEAADRRRWQEEMTRTKMMYDYEYDYYYSYRWPAWW